MTVSGRPAPAAGRQPAAADWPPVPSPPDGGPHRPRGAIITDGPPTTYELRP